MLIVWYLMRCSSETWAEMALIAAGFGLPCFRSSVGLFIVLTCLDRVAIGGGTTELNLTKIDEFLAPFRLRRAKAERLTDGASRVKAGTSKEEFSRRSGHGFYFPWRSWAWSVRGHDRNSSSVFATCSFPKGSLQAKNTGASGWRMSFTGTQ